MSTTYDWSSVLGPNGAISDYLKNMMFQKQLGGMFGQEQLPGAPAMQAQAQLPQQQMPGAPPMAAQAPGNQVTARMPGGYHPQIGGGNITVGGGPVDVSTPAIAPQTTYSGPVGQALGDQQSSALLPLFQALGPRSLPLLMQTTQNAMQHKQDMADKAMRTLSPQEAAARGYRGVVQEDAFGGDHVAQASDVPSQDAQDYQAKQHKITAITDQNDPRLPPLNTRPPGAQYGVDAYGNVVETLKGDAKSPLAQSQDMAERRAAAAAQMQALGVGGGGDQTQSPVVQSYVKNIHTGAINMNNVPMQLRGLVSQALAGEDKTQYTATAGSRYAMASSRITAPYKEMSGYKLTADAVPYLARIDAASKVPGSVSDQDLLDSLTKLNTGGNAVTDAQVSLITHGKSFADWANVLRNKFKTGGVLSDSQRQEIRDISANIYQNYRKSYQPIYDEVKGKLEASGIPQPFWTIPDLNSIGDQQMSGLGLANPGAAGGPPPPSGNVIHYDAQGNRIK